MRPQHILLLSDLSPESLRPTEPIAELARAIDARVTLLHIVEDAPIAPHGAPLAPRVSAPDTERQMHDAQIALDEQRTSIEGVEVTTKVVRGESVRDAVIQFAQQNDVDMIALSTHGRTGFRHLLLGSVAEAILRHSTTPVMTYPRVTQKH